jgi:hypothetical protein
VPKAGGFEREGSFYSQRYVTITTYHCLLCYRAIYFISNLAIRESSCIHLSTPCIMSPILTQLLSVVPYHMNAVLLTPLLLASSFLGYKN